MYQPEAYPIALLFMIGSMLCCGSWANTMKLTPGWPFQLFYWDYVAGIIIASLLWGLTFGSAGGGPLSFLNNIRSSDVTHILFALLGGAVFNVSDTRLSCDRRPAPARPDQHVRARDAASESGRPRLVSGRRRLAIAAHEAESEHRGNRGVGVGPELAQLTWGR